MKDGRTLDQLWADNKAGDLTARNRLIEHYQGLVDAIVTSMRPQPGKRGELRSHAVLGLIDAIAKFDPARGRSFVTYAGEGPGVRTPGPLLTSRWIARLEAAPASHVGHHDSASRVYGCAGTARTRGG